MKHPFISKKTRFVLFLFAIASSFVFAQEGDEAEPIVYPPDFVFPPWSCDFHGQFPYSVSVRDNTPQQEHICGGVLIHKDAVLTAAHCLDTRTTKKATTRPQLNLGGTDSAVPIEKRKTTDAFVHPDWTGDFKDGNDLIILKLDEPTCLPPIPTLGAKGAENRDTLFFLGFGRTSIGGTFSYTLNGGKFSSFNNTYCNERYNLEPPLRDSEMCVRAPTTVGICTGDDGSPLIYSPSIRVFRDVLIGIASYSTSDCTETEGASIFMNIEYYKDWINETLNSDRFLGKGK